jgi:hypothetical protein
LLNDPAIITASRKFVCVRPLTYESVEEANYLRKMFSRNGALENTVFAIMDPGAKRYLAEPNRMPYFAFPGSEQDPGIMAKGMGDLAKPFKPTAGPIGLPVVKGLRYAFNVAACDRRPVAVVVGSDGGPIDPVLLKQAWDEKYMGQFVYTHASRSELESFVKSGVGDARYVIVKPNEYGTAGTVLASASETDQASLSSAMDSALAKFEPWTLNHRTHLATAVKNGIRWKTVVPVEDKQALEAKERLWGTAQSP